ncbi:hypothetical protein CSAL01_12703 [Colletotrichum salicis]|uniref:Uncharacterized protein n=1 Tax=Colletotrichum salicis TaxID=1209931 RepID=A0A135UVC4_9PEZI|nr:hypothetical protein CSAL01_12703 [Colletotrichum salicis]
MISPEFWEPKYKPRYRLPWAFMTAFWFISPAMCLIIRCDENREEHEVLDTGDEVIEVHNEDLDLTDRQNLKFVYPL